MANAATHATFGFFKFFDAHFAHFQVVGKAPHVRSRANGFALKPPRQHWAAGQHNGWQIHTGRAHDERRRGFVAAREQHNGIKRIGSDAFFDGHAGQIAVEHGRGANDGFAQGHHRKFQRKTARFVNAVFDTLRQFSKMTVAGRYFRPSIADANDGLALELVRGVALIFQPTAVYKTIFPFFSKPILTAEFLLFCHFVSCV